MKWTYKKAGDTYKLYCNKVIYILGLTQEKAKSMRNKLNMKEEK